MKKIILAVFTATSIAAIFGCSNQPSKTAAKAGVNFGAALAIGDVLDEKKREVIAKNFNMIVAENTMKWEVIHPKRTFWNFSDMDSMVDFAEKNNMKVRGHTFIWHQQTPPYVSTERKPEALREMLQEHISELMARYKGKICEYDVCNEIFDEDGTFRKSFWYNTLGEDIYKEAFVLARKADPDAKLILNDYNNECAGNPKSDGQYEFARKLVAEGIPIDGIGMQLHIAEDQPFDTEAIRANIRRYAELGLSVSFTEIDVRLKMPPTEESVRRQQEIMCDLMNLILTEPNASTYVFWGYSDAHSWVPGFYPSYGDALPLDRDMKPKPVFNALVKMLGGSKKAESSRNF